MCTLVFVWQALPDAPVVAAANRDEALGRPSDPPGRFREEPAAIAPRDGTAGGTWIGYNEAGVFVGVTNRWVDREGDRSRGRLVADCLGCASTDEAVAHVREAVTPHRYAGFNLVVADADRAVCLEWDGTLSVNDFEPGIHVVVNVGVDDAFFVPDARPEAGREQAINARALRAALDPHPEETAVDWLDRAGAALGDHEYDVCIHGNGFGTRSASLISLESGTEEAVGRYWFADGPPCRTDFERVDAGL
ncbi:NRDE family protein [Halohasta salina]|uniref:NRDE family protein n=1 Tax=Halohasta salina TaxID=2961621 RepID=UPI0020A4C345|nr:NRDE family protein [Halohasta salina]